LDELSLTNVALKRSKSMVTNLKVISEKSESEKVKLDAICRKLSSDIQKLEDDYATAKRKVDSMSSDVTVLRDQLRSAKLESVEQELEVPNLRSLLQPYALPKLESVNDVVSNECRSGFLSVKSMMESFENVCTVKLHFLETKVDTLDKSIKRLSKFLEKKAVYNGVRERALYETNNVIQKRQKRRIVQLMKEVEQCKQKAAS